MVRYRCCACWVTDMFISFAVFKLKKHILNLCYHLVIQSGNWSLLIQWWSIIWHLQSRNKFGWNSFKLVVGFYNSYIKDGVRDSWRTERRQKRKKIRKSFSASRIARHAWSVTRLNLEPRRLSWKTIFISIFGDSTLVKMAFVRIIFLLFNCKFITFGPITFILMPSVVMTCLNEFFSDG